MSRVGLAPTLWRRRGACGCFLLSGSTTPSPLVVFLFASLFVAVVVSVVVIVCADVLISDLSF